MNTKFYISLSVLLVFLFFNSMPILAADNQEKIRLSDTEIRLRIVGIWIVDFKSFNDTAMSGSTSISGDGIFSTIAVIVKGKQKANLIYEGVWEVKDGFLIETVNKSSNPQIVPLGKVTRDYVIRLDENEFVYRTEDGKIKTRKRIMNK